MQEFHITPLGAGCEVGRSCMIASFSDYNIMLDCGLHVGYTDHRKFPDFGWLGSDASCLDAIIISHFHLDHVGALPYFVSQYKYTGPIYMTHPTLSIARIQLHDYRNVAAHMSDTCTEEEVNACLDRVQTIALHETFEHFDSEENRARLRITPYYAGHVLGAAMFRVECDAHSILYTGDYNMTADRHLGPAEVPPRHLHTNILITESTYATTIRESKRVRERAFLEAVHRCVLQNGKVLVPVFALGRAQELCLLLDAYWERMQLGDIPIYFASSVGEKSTAYYKLFTSWTSFPLRNVATGQGNQRSCFDYRHIEILQSLDDGLLQREGPIVLLTTPGMLHAGNSMRVFLQWCGDPKNLTVLPGFCVPGTFGHTVLTAVPPYDKERTTSEGFMVQYGKDRMVRVCCPVMSFRFSAHTDFRGILQLVRGVDPDHVVLVHGEAVKMKYVREKLQKELKIATSMPANLQTIKIQSCLPTSSALTSASDSSVVTGSIVPMMISGDVLEELYCQRDAVIPCKTRVLQFTDGTVDTFLTHRSSPAQIPYGISPEENMNSLPVFHYRITKVISPQLPEETIVEALRNASRCLVHQLNQTLPTYGDFEYVEKEERRNRLTEDGGTEEVIFTDIWIHSPQLGDEFSVCSSFDGLRSRPRRRTVSDLCRSKKTAALYHSGLMRTTEEEEYNPPNALTLSWGANCDAVGQRALALLHSIASWTEPIKDLECTLCAGVSEHYYCMDDCF